MIENKSITWSLYLSLKHGSQSLSRHRFSRIYKPPSAGRSLAGAWEWPKNFFFHFQVILHCKYFRCNSYDFLLYLIPRCTEDVLLMTICCKQQIAVLWLKYILFTVVFTSFSPIWQIDVVELKHIKLFIKSTADLS